MEDAELCRRLEEQYFGPNMHEREEIELLPGLLKGVKVFVDVGASLGPYSYHASKVITGAKDQITGTPQPFNPQMMMQQQQQPQ